ncbi:peptidoglycan recognition family protein [Krasilnikovia sp. M28-CT-15]|uniref:peptidoglycan recognition protein family protein n=1 Tax=Krasilnikovia sp. M28-CT-15 TaxID=3373540 RepID=UPI003876C07C
MTTRRAVLTAGAGTLAALALPRRAAAAVPRTAADRTLASRVAVTGDQVLRPESAFPLSHLVVRWKGTGRPAISIRYRTGWSSRRVATPVGSCGPGAGPVHRALLEVPAAVGYELTFVGGAAAGVEVTELNTLGGPSARALAVGGTSVRYLRRAAWGADESLRLEPDGSQTWPPAYFPVQTLTVHHTATSSGDRNPAATVRAIYYYHAITQDWGDIGYHLLIDEAGTVYEGRWSGTDPAPVFGPADAGGRPQMVNGAHVLGFNAGNVGVALLGTLTDREPTVVAREALTRVLATLAGLTQLDPLRVAGYVNPITGAARTVDVISGHRDWQPTICPGDRFAARLPALRRDVARCRTNQVFW